MGLHAAQRSRPAQQSEATKPNNPPQVSQSSGPPTTPRASRQPPPAVRRRREPPPASAAACPPSTRRRRRSASRRFALFISPVHSPYSLWSRWIIVLFRRRFFFSAVAAASNRTRLIPVPLCPCTTAAALARAEASDVLKTPAVLNVPNTARYDPCMNENDLIFGCKFVSLQE